MLVSCNRDGCAFPQLLALEKWTLTSEMYSECGHKISRKERPTLTTMAALSFDASSSSGRRVPRNQKMIVLLLLVFAFMAQSLVVQNGGKKVVRPLCMSSLDYEYIPPNVKAPAPFSSSLSSAYPPGTPAGLRGEAVRSALRSGRCIAWDLVDSSLSHGWIGVRGKGTTDFLNNKLSQSFSTTSNSFAKACLLTAKGRVLDQVCVAIESDEQAYLLTSPGHAATELYNRLDPLIFPMDQVTLEKCSPRVLTLASIKLEHVQEAITRFVMPLVGEWIKFPSLTESLFVSDKLVVLPHAVLPVCAGQGYTLILEKDLGERVWQALTSEENPEGPIGIGALEYETLRIEAGLPAFGAELTGGDKDKRGKAPGPLELHWESFLDLNKGCYLGQEGVASVIKNRRGPPRLLYSVVFDDDTNVYEHQSGDDKEDNLTVLPQVGQELFVLGSNEEIAVGTLTSVAEPGGTGEPTIVGLALIRRADSVLKQMKDMNLDVGESSFRETDPAGGDGMIPPPPLDPLDGLEVIVGGTFTVGRLRMVPSRQFRMGQNMFKEIDGYEPPEKEGSVIGFMNPVKREISLLDVQEEDEDDLAKAMEEVEKAKAEAEEAAAEAKRKEEKMEMLKKRAEEAMARRKKKKE
jgi:folate-binding Fe-S cluster repair protein YgfZ